MQVLDIGSRRELFVDTLLIDRLRNASLGMHAPQPREIVLRHDTPWEGPFSLYHTLVRDGARILLYYRGWNLPSEPAVYCVAESRDGIHFERPTLRMHAWNGSRENNMGVLQHHGSRSYRGAQNAGVFLQRRLFHD